MANQVIKFNLLVIGTVILSISFVLVSFSVLTAYIEGDFETRDFHVNNDTKRIAIYKVMKSDAVKSESNIEYEFIGSSLHHGARLYIDNKKCGLVGNNSAFNPLTEYYFFINIDEYLSEIYILDEELRLARKYFYDSKYRDEYSNRSPSMTEEQVIDKIYGLIKDFK